MMPALISDGVAEARAQVPLGTTGASCNAARACDVAGLTASCRVVLWVCRGAEGCLSTRCHILGALIWCFGAPGNSWASISKQATLKAHECLCSKAVSMQLPNDP